MVASRMTVKLAGTRLENSIELLNSLEPDTPVEETRAVLEEILANGDKNLAQLEEAREPELLHRTHASMALAQLRMASLAAPGSEQQARLAAAADHAELALAQTPADAPLDKQLEATAWAINLLAGAVGLASGVQRQALQRRLNACLNQFDDLLGRQVDQRLNGADLIFAGQMFLESALNLEEEPDRRAALDTALRLAGQAALLLESAGDASLAYQAQSLVDEINKAA